MKTLKITAKDLDKDNYYIGTEDFSECSKKYDGNIEIEGSLGTVRFKKGIHASYSIIANTGSGINAGWGINAGYGISAGYGIRAGRGINAGWGISAGRGISAGDGISAGYGVNAGYGIRAKLELSASYNIFAGTSRHIKAEGDDKKITCGKLVKGTIAYGDLVETRLPTETKEESLELLAQLTEKLK